MATIRQIGKGPKKKFQTIVRKGGHSLSRVFWKKSEAETWMRRVEDAIASATPSRPFNRDEWLQGGDDTSELDENQPHSGWTISRALKHYSETLVHEKKGAKVERYRIANIQKWPLAAKALKDLRKSDVQNQVNERLANKISGDTVRRELNILRALYRDAEEVWEIPDLPSPFHKLKLPPKAPPRDRRLEDGHADDAGEEERLILALGTWKRNPDIHVDMFRFSVETGFRLSELHAIHVHNIRRVDGVVCVVLGDSKNDDGRKVVLSTLAQEIAARRIEGRKGHEKLFPVSDSARRRAWAHARKMCAVQDLRWHDLRHEAVSRMASKGLHLKELMAQSGHRDTESVARYINERARDIARKLG
jgi:integrase